VGALLGHKITIKLCSNNLYDLKAIQNIYLDLITSTFGQQVFYTSVGLVRIIHFGS
jgi:hypothetical protein